MRRLILSFVAAALMASSAAAQTVILVRHAEKLDESADPPLTAAGQARAQALAQSLAGAHVTGVITSTFQRTIATAAPTATAAGVTPVTTPGAAATVLKALKAFGPAATVLVVGHSNTIPDVAKALGDTQPLNLDACFDRMTVIQLGGAAPRVVHARYGAPSPGC